MSLFYKVDDIILSKVNIKKQICFFPSNGVIFYPYNANGDKEDTIYFSNKSIQANKITISALKTALLKLGYVAMPYNVNYQVDNEVYEECNAFNITEQLMSDRYRHNPSRYLSRIPPQVTDLSATYQDIYGFYYTLVDTFRLVLDIELRNRHGNNRTVGVVQISNNMQYREIIKVGNKMYIFICNSDNNTRNNPATMDIYIFDPLTDTLLQLESIKMPYEHYSIVYSSPMIYLYASYDQYGYYYNTLTTTWTKFNGPDRIRSIFVSGVDTFAYCSDNYLYLMKHNVGNADIEFIKALEVPDTDIRSNIIANGRYIIIYTTIDGTEPLNKYLYTIYDRNIQKWLHNKGPRTRDIRLLLPKGDIYSLHPSLDDTGYITGKKGNIFVRLSHKNSGVCMILDGDTLEVSFASISGLNYMVLRTHY